MNQNITQLVREFSHYHKPCPYDSVDIYRILKMFEVTDPCLQHIVKKALCAGKRGAKDLHQDLLEIRATAVRALEMIGEEN
jgi:hypothetical protein